jgi:hypothetical protein
MLEILSLGNFRVPKLKKKFFFILGSDTKYPYDMGISNIQQIQRLKIGNSHNVRSEKNWVLGW